VRRWGPPTRGSLASVVGVIGGMNRRRSVSSFYPDQKPDQRMMTGSGGPPSLSSSP
jgi:hypothetical protein